MVNGIEDQGHPRLRIGLPYRGDRILEPKAEPAKQRVFLGGWKQEITQAARREHVGEMNDRAASQVSRICRLPPPPRTKPVEEHDGVGGAHPHRQRRAFPAVARPACPHPP